MIKSIINAIINGLRNFRKPLTYSSIITNDIGTSDLEKIAKTKKILIDNNVYSSKITIITQTSFTYDVANNIVNPQYNILKPNKKNAPLIEINKPEELMRVYTGDYWTDNNTKLIKNLVKSSKRGIAIKTFEDINDLLCIANLDDAVNHYNEVIEETLNYNT